MKEVNSINVEREVFLKVKKYCELNGFKLSKWCSIQLDKALNEQESKNAK